MKLLYNSDTELYSSHLAKPQMPSAFDPAGSQYNHTSWIRDCRIFFSSDKNACWRIRGRGLEISFEFV